MNETTEEISFVAVDVGDQRLLSIFIVSYATSLEIDAMESYIRKSRNCRRPVQVYEMHTVVENGLFKEKYYAERSGSDRTFYGLLDRISLRFLRGREAWIRIPMWSLFPNGVKERNIKATTWLVDGIFRSCPGGVRQ